jgi:hypothetical protein
LTRSSWTRLFTLLAALVTGIAVAILDRGASEVQPAVLLLFASALAFAWFRPAEAWLSALLLGAGVPGLDLVSRILGAPPAFASVPGSSLLAFAPALFGAAAGSGLRRMLGGRPA